MSSRRRKSGKRPESKRSRAPRLHNAGDAREPERVLIATQRELHGQIQGIYSSLTEADVHIPREILVVLAHAEAVSDILVETGIVSRTQLNIRRFRYLLRYLYELAEKNGVELNTEAA